MIQTDIVISGAGIAGLWLFNRLKRAGYDVLLLERDSVGCGQTVASQGIIHSGLKYAFAGQINALAKSISTMPNQWRDALRGDGPVDLSSARVTASSQYLLIPPGLMGGLISLVTKKTLGNNVHELKKSDWPSGIIKTGFNGTVIFMDEPVLDVPSTLHALANPFQNSIRKADILKDADFVMNGMDIDHISFDTEKIKAQRYIFTAAESNKILADRLGHSNGLETQHRPLLMGMMNNAPCELYAHCVGPSDKPIMTITTHRALDGSLVWYLGGNVADRNKESNPNDVYIAAREAFEKYMPNVDLSRITWSTLAIDRVEGKTSTMGHMPDTPTIHRAGNSFYCWPTKLTFAPMLANTIVENLDRDKLTPSGIEGRFDFLPACPVTETPWDRAIWTKAA